MPTWIIVLLAIVLALIIITVAYLRLNPQFGGRITPALWERYAKSPQWNNSAFENQIHTVVGGFGLKAMMDTLRMMHKNRKVRRPAEPLTIRPFDSQAWQANPELPKVIWYGHSVGLLQLGGKNFLIDPMLGPDAAPVSPVGGVKRFSANTLDLIDSLPPLEAVLLSHDHYDHLDYASIKRLKPKVNRWLVALGVGRHLESWGIPTEQITELDWWDEIQMGDLTLAFTPSRHFTGRGTADRQKSLWGGFVFLSPKHRIFWSGDGGEGPHFEEIGKKYGPFDWGFMECGQYNMAWHDIHMMPDEVVTAAKQADVKVAFPVHWAGFALSPHAWTEPAELFVAQAEAQQQDHCIPKLGQVVTLGQEPAVEAWWQA